MRTVCLSQREGTRPISRGMLLDVNDYVAAWAFGCELEVSYTTPLEDLGQFDALFVIQWKRRLPLERVYMEKIREFKARWPEKKVIVHQEGEGEWFLMLSAWLESGWPEEFEMLQALGSVDVFLAHNQKDAHIYRRLMPAGKVFVWNSLLDVEAPARYVHGIARRPGSIAVNTYDGRAGGVLALAIAKRLTGDIIQVNRTGYDDGREDALEALWGVHPERVPRTGLGGYLEALARASVYLAPMTAAAAGRDQIWCAALGTPIIGNQAADTQRILWPDLAVDPYDVSAMERLCKRLLGEPDFYTWCVALAQKRLPGFAIVQGPARAKAILEQM